MKFLKSISLHPKLAAFIDLFVGILYLWWFGRIGSPWMLGAWFAFRPLWWAVLTVILYYPPTQSRFRQWLSLTGLHLGFTGLFLIVPRGSGLLSWQAVSVIYLALPFISFMLVPTGAAELSFTGKPLRRLQLIMAVAGVAGLWSALYAAPVFQVVTRSGSYLWGVSGILVVTLIGAWWWRVYTAASVRHLFLDSIPFALLLSELAYALSLLPLGFLVAGFLFAWGWYIIWLLLRFHLSREGIFWRRQATFLIGNLLLMIAYVALVVRWR